MKPTILLVALLGAVLTVQAQTPPPKQGRDRYYQPDYQGGGIRGRMVALADGELLTPAEVAEINSEGQEPPQRRRALVPDGPKPQMPIVRPKERTVSSPFSLELAFPPEAAVDSFRTYYGPQKVDITPRITGHASIDPQGMRMEKAQLPPGKHVLHFEVKTPQGPVTSQLAIDVR